MIKQKSSDLRQTRVSSVAAGGRRVQSEDKMAPVYGWRSGGAGAGGQQVYISSQGDSIAEDLNTRLKKNFLATLCRRPAQGVTEVRRDNKDTVAVAKVIKKEFVSKMDVMDQQDFINHMHAYASAAWVNLGIIMYWNCNKNILILSIYFYLFYLLSPGHHGVCPPADAR